MKRYFPRSVYNFLCLSLLTLMVFGCGTPVVEKERKAISRGVYATKDAMDVSRFDLAKSYNYELTRIVPPPTPKDRIKILAFETDIKPASKKTGAKAIPSQRYVVLPDTEKNSHVIVANSPEYQELLNENTSLRLREAAAQSALAAEKLRIDGVLREKDTELQKLRAEPSFFQKVWSFVKALFKWGPLALIVVLAVLLILSPFIGWALPIFFGVLKVLFIPIKAIGRGISYIFTRK